MTQMNGFYVEKTDGSFIHGRKKSVKYRNPWSSVILTTNDIIKAHGGELSVKTIAGQGTTFSIRIHPNNT